jgi:hypothetical protein
MSTKKPFVVKHGLDVADNLIFAENQKVGIQTSLPDYTLDVDGSLGISSAFYVPTENVEVKTAVGIVSNTSFDTISGIDTSLILVGDYVTGDYIQDNTRITSIGSSTLSILPIHENNSGPEEKPFLFLRYKFSGKSGNFLKSRGPNKSPIWSSDVDLTVSYAKTAFDVIGGIASVTQLYVNPGISTFVGIITATDAYFSGLVAIEDLVVIDTLDVGGATTLNSTLDVDGATTLNNTLGVSSATTLSSTLNVDGVTSLNDKTIITGNSDSLLTINHQGSENALQINNYKFSVKTGSFNASSGVSTVIDSYSLLNDEYDTMEYTLNIINGDNIQAQKVLVLQNTTKVYSSEYGIIFNNKPIVSIGVSIVNSSYELKLTPESGISGLTTYKFIRGGIV